MEISNNWKYELDLSLYDSSKVIEHKMYFTNLKDSFQSLLDQCLRDFLPFPLRENINGKGIVNADILDTAGKPIVQVKIDERPHGNEEIRAEGLYFNFPQGIKNFETDTGISLSHFKGYNSGIDYVLAAYLVKEEEWKFKESTGYRLLKEQAQKHLDENLRYSVEIEHAIFGSPTLRSREIDFIRFRESYFFKDEEEALIAMLNIDFNRLDEGIAWDNDIKSFYSSVELGVRKGLNSELVYTKNQRFDRYGDVRYNGIYIILNRVDSPLVNLSTLKPAGERREHLRLLAKYNDTKTCLIREPGLEAIIKNYMEAKSGQIVKRKQSSPRNVLPEKKGKGRGL